MDNIVTVIGSINTDLVIRSRYFPKPGETIIGGTFNTFAGGKGANQAVAVARLGKGSTKFVAKIGNDDLGSNALEGLKKEGIHTEYIFVDDQRPSGVAVIIVDDSAQNSIVVASGANDRLSTRDIDNAITAIESANIILIQLETPITTVAHVLEVAARYKKRTILNPAPAIALDERLYEKIFLITPNETETTFFTGIEVTDQLSASAAAQVFLDRGVENVVITLGEKGAYFKNKQEHFLIPAKKVESLDTTAAGDTFNGALAVALSEGNDWREAILFANNAASISVGRLGAQSSVPYRYEL